MHLTGWGRYPRIQAQGSSFETPEQLHKYLQGPEDVIVHAQGRSYGDSALNDRVIFTRRFDKVLHFDPEAGLLTCESGFTLADLLQAFLPRGWFLPVTPGTKFITIGGAIASDIHGKNHHRAGCFSEYVDSLDLLLPQGEVVRVSPRENRPLFRATCGGMGLTGVILRATLRLQPVKSALIRETVIRCANLEEVFHLFKENRTVTYSVAWIDCLAPNGQLGRSLLMLGEHAETGRLHRAAAQTISIPLELPSFCLNRYAIKLFNQLYYRKQAQPIAGRLVPLDDFFFPLDKIGHWNRMYGRRGFTQYQLALPKEASFAGLKEILERLAAAGLGSFLGVLKLLGRENANYLSFPLEGYTLAVDLKITDRLFPFLNELDRIVLDHGGRLYLTKDVRMSGETFRRGYPRWEQFAELREKMGWRRKYNSRQSKRLGV